MRLSTLTDIGRSHGIDLMGTDHLRPLVQVGDDEPFTFENFLSKFATLRLFYRSPDVIGRITREAVEDAAKDNVRYFELRFTPVALSRAEGFPLAEVIDWVLDSAAQAAQDFGVITRLIVSVNRNESVELAEEVLQLAIDRKERGIVGVDLAGSEATHPASPFVGPFRAAQAAGMHVTIHAGEWGGAPNVRQAIEEFHTERIGHGVRVMEDADIVALARERQTAFEVCITSNYQSGVVSTLNQHPFPGMLSAGLNATLNTDDPNISQIVLSNEYRLVCEELNISLALLRERVLAAARAAFLPEAERASLISQIETEFAQRLPGL